MASGSARAADATEAGLSNAAVEAAAGSPAVAEILSSMDDLARIAKSQLVGGHAQQWALNNQALKYYRWIGEEPVGVPIASRSRVEFDLTQLATIGAMERAAKGPGFSFTAPSCVGRFLSWSPAQFLSQLRSSSVEELGLEQHKVKQLTFERKPDSRDFWRMTAAKQDG